jgi:hypothetical protein
MARSLVPFKISGEARTPLSIAPYNSRFPIHYLNDDEEELNYKYVAFRPGFALSNSELNDMQELFYKEQTCMAYMINSWSYYIGEPYDGSGDEGSIRYGGPGWNGATPITPYGEGLLPPDNVVPNISLNGNEYNLVDVDVSDSEVIVQFNEGYYYTPVRTDSELDNNLKYFVYLNYIGALGEDLFTVSIPRSSSGQTFVGLSMRQRFILPEPRSNEANTSQGSDSVDYDSTLRDNSAGFFNDSALGAARVKIEFTNASSAGENGQTDLDVISPVLYIDHTSRTVRYMNNLIIRRY